MGWGKIWENNYSRRSPEQQFLLGISCVALEDCLDAHTVDQSALAGFPSLKQRNLKLFIRTLQCGNKRASSFNLKNKTLTAIFLSA